jgi:hypothetical protein
VPDAVGRLEHTDELAGNVIPEESSDKEKNNEDKKVGKKVSKSFHTLLIIVLHTVKVFGFVCA